MYAFFFQSIWHWREKNVIEQISILNVQVNVQYETYSHDLRILIKTKMSVLGALISSQCWQLVRDTREDRTKFEPIWRCNSRNLYYDVEQGETYEWELIRQKQINEWGGAINLGFNS